MTAGAQADILDHEVTPTNGEAARMPGCLMAVELPTTPAQDGVHLDFFSQEK